MLIQRILVGVGLALVVLLAAIASLVTRWVVLPVRHAAQAAQRVSAGHLEERMQVLGVDDLAALATSFNEMAASLQAKLAELEELSSVQRQFVSDVSHELRTPLSTIKMAADLLFESRQELDAAGGRSAELLQSQLERFEELLVDLLEISRYDAGAATLEANLVDVCDLVRRSADDAQQLAERKGSRIEFRLPATGCFAEVDRRRVERILRNILVNAVEHGEGKDVVVTADDRQRRGRRLGPGLRRGPAPGRAAAGLRTVLAGRPGPGPHQRRHRPGPGHLAGGRAAARRLAAGLGREGQGLGVPADPAARRRRRSWRARRCRSARTKPRSRPGSGPPNRTPLTRWCPVANARRRARLGVVRRMCVLAAAVASVAGCVGMPSNGPAQQFSASPQSSGQDGNLIGSVPLGPQSGDDPSEIVAGFLTAADSFPLYGVAEEYLTSSAVKSWNPGFAVTVFSKMNGPNVAPTPTPSPSGGQRAKVEVTGTVQASSTAQVSTSRR